jgi:YD repeat-containing protein
MANPFLNSLVKAQAAGAATGQMTGPTVASGQIASSAGAATAAGSGGINGLLGGGISSIQNAIGSGFATPFSPVSFAAPGAGGWGGLSGGAHPCIPNVGGVLFDRCAEVLTEIGEITGAYWDDASSSMVLLGRENAEGNPVAFGLPAMDRDHLAVALRAAIAGDPTGVSIDPPARYKSRQQDIRDGTNLLVSYLGGTADTLAGAILFEADRLMKCLSMGKDNETGRELRAHVPGYRPLIEMVQPNSEHAGSWHRFWFVIDKVVMCQDRTSGALLFKDVRIQVLSEVELGGDACPAVDENDRAFTGHLTRYYDDYAKEFPVLARLRELAKIAALAKYLAGKKVPLDLEALFSTPPQAVATPTTTKAIRVVSPNVLVTQTGNRTLRRTISLCGGVDLRPPPPVIEGDANGRAGRFHALAQAARPSPTAARWEFSCESATMRAHAIPVGAGAKAKLRYFDDYNLSAQNPFRVRRSYNVSAPAGDFGAGWTFWIPFSLSVRQTGGKQMEVLEEKERQQAARDPCLVLHDHELGEAAIYQAIGSDGKESAPRFGRVTFVEDDDDSSSSGSGPNAKPRTKRRSFYYDANDFIVQTPAGYSWKRGDRRFEFDADGRLVEYAVANDKKKVAYTYRNGALLSLRDEIGNVIEIQRDSANRIAEILVPGHKLRYLYESGGLLASLRIDGMHRQTCEYDAERRLVQVRQGAGAVSCDGVYDDLGLLVLDGAIASSARGAGVIRRSVKNGRVVTAVDEARSHADFSYSAGGSLQTLTIHDTSGKKWIFAYDHQGRLVAVRNSPGQSSVSLRYDNATGLLVEWKSGMEIMEFAWHGDRQLISARKNGKLVFNGALQHGDSDGAKPDVPRPGGAMRSTQGWKSRTRDALERLRKWNPFCIKKTALNPNKSGRASAAESHCGFVQYKLSDDALTLAVRFGPQ